MHSADAFPTRKRAHPLPCKRVPSLLYTDGRGWSEDSSSMAPPVLSGGFIHFELSRLTSNDHATSHRSDVPPPATHGRNASRLLLRAPSRHARCNDVQCERERGEGSEGEEGDGPCRIGCARRKSNESQIPAENVSTHATSRSEIRERRSRAIDANACRNLPRRSSA